MKADLHIHSIYSDGKQIIKELTEYAESKNIDLIAITDHDSVGSYKDIKKIKTKVKVLIGVELSTDMNGENIHILGYFYNNTKPSKEFISFLEDKKQKREARAYEIIKRLKKYYDIDITYEEIVKYSHGIIGRPHIAMAIEKRHGISFDDVFKKYIGNDQKAYIPSDHLDIKDAISLLKKNKALVVLAHPILIKKNSIDEIIKLGIEGIEVKYPMLNEEDEKAFYDLAGKNNLVVTGGSDYHGPDTLSDMGEKFITGDEVNKFLSEIYRLKE